MAAMFDDGVIHIYNIENLSELGEIPRKGLVYFESFSFCQETLGVKRFYEALRSEQLIEKVITTYRDDRINVNQVGVMEDGSQYQIRMVQTAKDDDGIEINKISLERIVDPYEIIC